MLSQLQKKANNRSRLSENGQNFQSSPQHSPNEPEHQIVEESKEQPQPQSQIQRHPHIYNPQMPRLSSIGMMTNEEVLHELRTLDASIYYGYEVTEIMRHITMAEAWRYLSELALCNEKVKSKLKEISEASSSQSQESCESRASSDRSIKLSFKSNQNSSNSDGGPKQQLVKEEEKEEPAPIQNGPSVQQHINIIDRNSPQEVRQKIQVENKGFGKPVPPIPEENKIAINQRTDASVPNGSTGQSVQKKGPWQPAIGIDHVSERSDYDENERLSEVEQAKCQVEAAQFLEKSGRSISSPDKPIEKRPAIEALGLSGFLSNHRGSGKQTKKIEKSDAGLSVIQFPSIRKKKK